LDVDVEVTATVIMHIVVDRLVAVTVAVDIGVDKIYSESRVGLEHNGEELIQCRTTCGCKDLSGTDAGGGEIKISSSSFDG
jgi:hypothetical protein